MQGDKPALLLGSSDGQVLGDTTGWKNAHEQDAEIDLYSMMELPSLGCGGLVLWGSPMLMFLWQAWG